MHSINNILSPIVGVQVAHVTYKTNPIAVGKRKLKAEGYSDAEIAELSTRFVKHQTYSVIIAGKLNADTNIYVNQVKRTVEGIEPEDFVFGASKYDNIFGSLVSLKTDPNAYYLNVLVNKCNESIIIDTVTNTQVTKQHVAQYLTDSAKDKLLNPQTEQHNVTNDATHTSQPRFWPLTNIVSISANGKVYSGKFTK